jgi:hypothetical protein
MWLKEEEGEDDETGTAKEKTESSNADARGSLNYS